MSVFPFGLPVRSSRVARRPPSSRWRRFHVEELEGRLTPANGAIDLGELQFVGDYVQSGDTYTFTGNDIELGYEPLAGQAFEPVYAISGSVTFDLSATPQVFQVNGTVSTATGGTFGPITVWTGQDTFNVEDLVSDGFSLSGQLQTTTFEGAQFTINSIGLGAPPNANDPDAYTPQVQLRGQLSLFNSELVVAINGDNYVGIGAEELTLTGFSVAITQSFDLFGIDIMPKNLTFSYNQTEKQFEIYGGVEFKLEGGDSNITASLGNSQNPGLLIDDGEVTEVSFGIDGVIDLGGDADDDDLIQLISPENAPLTLAWEGASAGNSFFLSGTGSIKLGSSMQASVNLGTQGNPGISVVDGAFMLNMISLSLGDIDFGAFTLKSLQISFTQTADSFQIGGEVYVTIPGNWGLQGELEFDSQGVDNISFDLTLGEEGVPIGPTGLFVTEIGAGVQNIGEPADFTISGNIGLDYGGQVAIAGKSATIFSASGQFSLNKDSFNLSGTVGFGTYTVTNNQGQKTVKNLFGGGSGAVDLDWGSGDYSASFNASFLDNSIAFGGNFSLDNLGDVDVSADADLNVPKAVPLIGGDHIIGGQAVFQWFGPQATGYLAAWATVAGIDAGFEYDLANFNGSDGDFTIIGNGSVNSITSGENNPAANVYSQSFQVPEGATIGTFQVTWPAISGSQTVTLTPPAAPGQSNSPITPTTTPTNGITLVSQELTTFTVQAVSPSGDPDTPLPSGEYTLTLTSNVSLTPSFTGTFSYPQPTVVIGTLPSNPTGSSISIPITATVDDAFQSETTISVFYDTDASGYDGRLIATIPFAASTSVTWNFTNQLPTGYYVYAQIKSGSNSTFTIPSSQSPVYSAYSTEVTPSPPLSGTVKDTNGDAISGIVVYLDLNGDKTYQAPVFNAQGQQTGGDVTATTNRNGVFVFYSPANPPPVQEYSVGIVIPNGYLQSSPLFNPTPVLGPPPATVEFVLDRLNIITGKVYADDNRNGQQDPGELPYAGEELYVDLNGNQTLDFGEPTANSSATGTYTFYNVAPGSTSIVRWNGQAPFTQITPAPASGETLGSYTIAFSPTQQFEAMSGNDFGLLRLATISGAVTAYPIVNGQTSSTATPLAGITVLLQNAGGTVATTTSLADGSFSFPGVVPGDYTIAQQLPSGYRQLTPLVYQFDYTERTFQTQAPGVSSTNPSPLGAHENWTGEVPSSFAAGDFYGDGKTDYVVLGGLLTQTSSPINTGYPPGFEGSPFPIVETNISTLNLGNAYIYYSALDGLQSPTPAAQVATAYPIRGFGFGVGPQIVLPLDFFGTGQLDIAVASQNGVTVLRNNGNRSFAALEPETLPSYLNSTIKGLVAGDFNNDGTDELISIAVEPAHDNQPTLFLVYTYGVKGSTSSTSFANYYIGAFTSFSYPIPINPINTSVIDINGDGNLDFAVSNDPQGFLYYALGDGKGNFKVYPANLPAFANADSSTSTGYNAIALGDIDDDGQMDAVYSYSTLNGGTLASEGVTHLLFAEWSATDNNWKFSPLSIQLPAGTVGYYSTDDISLTDLNGDSLPDLTVLRANYGGHDALAFYTADDEFLAPLVPVTIYYEIAVFLNNGTGTPFAATPTKTFTQAGPSPSPYTYLAMGNPRLTLGGLAVQDTGVLSVWQNLTPFEPGITAYLSARTAVLSVSITASDRRDITGIAFVNTQTDQAAGVVYNDKNRNGIQDAGDTGVAGATLYSDTNGNGAHDPGEPTATTNAAGAYSFSNLSPGPNTIRLDTDDDLATTSAPDDSYTVNVPGGTMMRSFAAAEPSSYDFGVSPRLLQDVPAQTAANEQPFTGAAPAQTTAGQAQNLKFRLVGDVPAGASVDPLTGSVSWRPAYNQAPGLYRLFVQAFDLADAIVTETVAVDIAVSSIPSPERFVADLYESFLGRLPEEAGLAAWTGLIAGGVPLSEITAGIQRSDECLGHTVDRLYRDYLNRAADPEGRVAWIAQLRSGATEFELAARFVESDEFNNNHPTLDTFVIGLYATILDRSPSTTEIGAWLSLNFSRPQMASHFLQSPEAFLRFIDDAYVNFLGRNPEAEGREGWLSAMSAGISPEAIAAGFANSEEFYSHVRNADE